MRFFGRDSLDITELELLAKDEQEAEEERRRADIFKLECVKDSE